MQETIIKMCIRDSNYNKQPVNYNGQSGNYYNPAGGSDIMDSGEAGNINNSL